jgi:putative ABC transport system substrate-binding protein
MQRRNFMMGVTGSALLWPTATYSQRTGRTPRIGFVTGRAEDAVALAWIEEVRKRLAELGWIDGRNVRIEVLADDNAERWESNARKMVLSEPDVIIVVGNPGVSALQSETKTIPIAFVQVGNPVGSGFVASLARSGGNITGFMHFEPEMGAKWLEILKTLAPTLARALVLYLPDVKANVEFLGSAEAAAQTYQVRVNSAGIRTAEEVEDAIMSFAREPNGGLIILPNPISATHRTRIAELALQHKLPSVAAFRYFVSGGLLASYGIDASSLYRRAAEYADRILKNEKPSDLPVQAPTKYELSINLRAARTINLEIPPLALSLADEVIE